MRPPEFWTRDDGRARLLEPLGRAYGLAGRWRRRLTRPFRAPVPVVCVGNLTVGGSGKTPTVLAIAKRLLERGVRVHVLTRGYGGRVRGPLMVDPAQHDARGVGDEALLLAEVAPTWVARERRAGALAAAQAGAELILMDDGFQNPTIRQDVGLLVIDGEAAFGNGRVLPAGPLREPVADGLARASAAVIVGPDPHDLDQALPEALPRLRAEIRPAANAGRWSGLQVVAFAGIGRPEKFFQTLAALGADVVVRRTFPDHHAYRREELEALMRLSKEHGATLITTAKDWVRLPDALRPRVSVLPVELVWQDPEALDRVLVPALRSRAITL